MIDGAADALLDVLEPVSVDIADAEGWARDDVVRELHRLAARLDPQLVPLLIEAELGKGWQEQIRAAAPSCVLVLAAATVPGLAVDATCCALAVGSHVRVRAGARERVLLPWLDRLSVLAPDLAARVEIVDEATFDGVDGAIVYGSDETVGWVTSQLPAGAPLAAYGTREAIAVVAPDAPSTWADGIATDIATFAQGGCMSPRRVFAVGDEARAARIAADLGRALELVTALHCPMEALDPARARADADAATVAAMRAGGRLVATGRCAVSVHTVADITELGAAVSSLGSLLQTCVVATGGESADAIVGCVESAGVTRTCAPGEAQLPEPTWLHDGIGRYAPLAGATASRRASPQR